MTKSLRVQFDGKVLIPQEPVDLPIDEVLEIEVVNSSAPEPGLSAAAVMKYWLEHQPPVDRGDMPSDGAAQHDHYLYGHHKRP
jgi:hypothetical protein